MGLAIAQVRLLALTTRKADIELQMQVDAKRKQMLTRQSTLLSQEYYSRLQNSNIQYATSSGYEDVNYNYLMGQTSNGQYTDDFLSQIIEGTDYGIVQKLENRMILTNQYGEVVTNNELARVAKEAKDTYSDQSVSAQACHALIGLVLGNKDVSSKYSALYNEIQNLGEDNVVRYMQLILENGGYKTGGTIYQGPDDNGVYYNSPEAAINKDGARTSQSIVNPQAGYCYSVNLYTLNSEGKPVGTPATINGISVQGNFYDGDHWTNLKVQWAKYIGNLISYFGPMLTAAIQNGTTATFSETLKTEQGYSAEPDDDNVMHYYKTDSTGKKEEVTKGEAYTYSVEENKGYEQATRVENLQAGFKSGVYQLCMVTDRSRGIYHKNTTLDYFTHMNYVVEKTDSSEREEITAWFNAEQAAISEKETYWDEEIQNLSTELSSVNTEIESVKTLKSNAIKSVFDWGGS